MSGKLLEGRHVAPTTSQVPEIFIFEFSAGETIVDAAVPRSSRVIVRFDDPGLERDPEFDAYSTKIAGGAAALIGGLGSVPSHRIDAELTYLAALWVVGAPGGCAGYILSLVDTTTRLH